MTTLIASFTQPVDRDTAYNAFMASDLANEAVSATEDGQTVECHSDIDGEHELRILWMSYEGRAGIVTTQGTGDALWTDASSPADAARRYREDDLNP